MQNKRERNLRMLCALLALALLALPIRMAAQADNDDPPGRAARLGYLQGSVSFQPAGESEWVEAMPNRPMTTGDKLWTDRDSRAEVQLGSISIFLNSNTGFSFLNLDDRTVQIQFSSGAIDMRVRRMHDDDVIEVDTPNQAFSVLRPGRYKVQASEDGTYTVVTVGAGEGESTGNGQTYTVHEGMRATFSGSDRLNADVEVNGEPDDFDEWADRRDRGFDDSPTARYVSPDVVGAEDLDQYGDWYSSPEYGPVWYPRVPPGWAPYHSGHWAWIDPWGWTWVDDAPWGYAPFHYGRWAFVEGRWGWVPGPPEVRPVYAPALVVFVGGAGPAMGGNVAWFPLGPREVYVPPYQVSPAYVNRVNVSNTTVTQTTVTNVYNTTVINNTTVVNNVTYVNKNVSGAVTAVPQQAFAGGQPVAKAAVPVTRQQLAAAPVTARVAVAPAHSAVVGVQSNAAVPVAAPPAAVVNRPAIATSTPPPAPIPFAAKQQALEAHPGQPITRQEMQRIRPANLPAAQPLVRQAPPAKPALADAPRPASQPVQSATAHPSMNQPVVNRPQPNAPAMNRPAEPARVMESPERDDRPAAVQPISHTMPQSEPVRDARPAEPARAEPAARPQTAAPAPAAARPAQPVQPQQPAARPKTQDDKKHANEPPRKR